MVRSRKPSKSNATAGQAANPGTPLPKLLGHYHLELDRFPNLDEVFTPFRTEDFAKQTARRRFRYVNKALLKLIHDAPKESFLLGAVIEYIERVNVEEILGEPYHFSNFEFWLNHFSHLTEDENYKVRTKIVGKGIPRDAYQCFFPIGMGKHFRGSHFVAAHASPDVDTTVASFWGWVDAIGARVSRDIHIWSLPSGPPDAHITKVLLELFGASVFLSTANTANALTMTGMDLVRKTGLVKKPPHTPFTGINHGPEGAAVVLIDHDGHYIGDWRSSDVESARQVVMSFNSCLRWFENNIHTTLISTFAKEILLVSDIPPLLSAIFDVKIADCEPIKDYPERQKKHLHEYISKVIGVTGGIQGTFGQLAEALDRLSITEFGLFHDLVSGLATSDIFDKEGHLREDRPRIFNKLEQIIKAIDAAILGARTYADRLDMMMAIKHQVLGLYSPFATLKSDVEEIREKIKNHRYLTVVIPEEDKKLFPVGVISATDLRKPSLGTVTLRDFSDPNETNLAPYLEVISVVDHHRASLQTSMPPLALIGDAQSCNVLTGEQAFLINERYGSGGMNHDAIDQALAKTADLPRSPAKARLQQRLLQRQMAAHHGGDVFIHPKREFTEYMCFLFAILDDTDLLSKVSTRDVLCVAHLLNKLKSLSVGEDVEIMAFDDIPKDHHFAKQAAQRILQNEDMYSVYKRIYDFNEQQVEENIATCAEGKPSSIFADTKVQNGCGRVGQTKIFAANAPTLCKHVDTLRSLWYDKAVGIHAQAPKVDLHLHMMSTITGADEVYTGNIGNYAHRDQMWLWIPETPLAIDHLASFLHSFHDASEVVHNKMEVEFLGNNTTELEQVFQENFGNILRKVAKDAKRGLPIVVLRYNASSLNSRKSMITPHIPHLIA